MEEAGSGRIAVSLFIFSSERLKLYESDWLLYHNCSILAAYLFKFYRPAISCLLCLIVLFHTVIDCNIYLFQLYIYSYFLESSKFTVTDSSVIWSWSVFAAKSSDHGKINSITITPNPPVKGQKLTITANTTVGEYSQWNLVILTVDVLIP